MIGGRLPASLLAAAGALLAAAAPPAEPPLLSYEGFYKDAMECKVRVEALQAIPGKARGRKKTAKALAYWTEQARIAGAKLGKGGPEIMKDEILFGLGGAGGPDALVRANHCVTAASIGLNYRKRGTPY